MLTVKLFKYNNEGKEVVTDAAFRGETETLLDIDDFDAQYNDQLDLIMHRLQDFVSHGSGWSIREILSFEIHTAAYTPLSGSSYIPTPKYIAKKKAVLNVQNGDSKCFVWSVLAALHPQKRNGSRAANYYKYEHEISLEELEFPLSLQHVKKFEKNNHTISISVFAFDGKTCIYPCYVTANKGRQHHVNLLLLTHGEKKHYTWIKNMSRLLRDTNGKHTKYWCNYCLHGFYKQEKLDRHVVDCSKMGIQKVILPDEEDCWVQFKSIQRMLKCPFTIYADFESFTSKIQGPSKEGSGTHAYELHVPSGFCYYVVCADPSRQFKPIVYRGPEVVETFIRMLVSTSDELCNILRKPIPMKMTKEEEENFHKAENCYLCNEPLGVDRRRDHCHLTGM